MALDYSVFKNQNNETLFKAKFSECDANGNLIDFGNSYPAILKSNYLKISKETIPLHKIISLDSNENICTLTYYDKLNIVKGKRFTYRALLKSSIQNKVAEFIQKVSSAKSSFLKTPAGKEEIIPAPPDTCHVCGSAGGVPVVFNKILSFLKVSLFRYEEAIYCKKHIKTRGLFNNVVINSIFGWWSLHGIIYTPNFLYLNAKEIRKKSDLPFFLIILITLLCFWPIGLVVYLISKG